MKYHSLIYYIFSTVFIASLFLLNPKISSAATGLTIQPIKVSETLKAGESNSGKFLLTNASDDDVEVEIKVEDFVPAAGSDTLQFVGRAPGVTTVRDWITIGVSPRFLFKKGASIEIPYTIVAPSSAEPGSHFGVIFLKATKASEAASEIKVGTQVGVLVFVTIPGNFQQKGVIKSFSAPLFVQRPPVNFTLSFENTGTVHFEPKGEIKIKNIFGKEVGSTAIEGYAILPTGIKDMNFSWNVDGLLVGRYVANALIRDNSGEVISSAETVFYALPLWYILAFLLGIVVIFFIIKFIKSKLNINISVKS